MEELLELYLYKYKQCPLPGIGCLQLTEGHAVAWYADKKIEAPVPSVRLSDTDAPADGLLRFLELRKNISREEAVAQLSAFCGHLKSMNSSGETALAHTGKFFINAEGRLVFRAAELPRAFFQPVVAERVLHEDVSHDMVVGDRQTTSAEMAAYYADAAGQRNDKWWLWALVLFLAAVTTLAFYWYTPGFYSSTFGNTQKFQTQPSSKTYRVTE